MLANVEFGELWVKPNIEFPGFPKGSVDPILNKLSPFLLNTTIRNIVCQRPPHRRPPTILPPTILMTCRADPCYHHSMHREAGLRLGNHYSQLPRSFLHSVWGIYLTSTGGRFGGVSLGLFPSRRRLVEPLNRRAGHGPLVRCIKKDRTINVRFLVVMSAVVRECEKKKTQPHFRRSKSRV